MVAAAGVLMTTNLALAPLTGAALFCAPQSECGVVHAGRYATFLGLPTSAWGLTLYAVVGAAALLGLTPRRWIGVFVLGVVAVSTSAYLKYVALFVLGARCTYCLVSLVIASALFAALLRARPRAVDERSWLRPGSLALVGSFTAAATVAVISVAFRLGAEW